MNVLKIPTNRFPSRVLTLDEHDPTDIPDDIDVVTIHPGWKKDPVVMEPLMGKLSDAGMFPIAVDTRLSCADQPDRGFWPIVGGDNPYFDDADRWGNRYAYRQPTALLHIFEHLGIERTHFVGHSNGGRIGQVAAMADNSPVRFDTMVLENSVGTGQTGGWMDLVRSNVQTIRDIPNRPESIRKIVRSAADSTMHFTSRLRRSMRERDMLDEFPAWYNQHAGHVADRVGRLIVINSVDDYLVSSDGQNPIHPNIEYVVIDGGHSNMYHDHAQDVIVSQFVQ